ATVAALACMSLAACSASGTPSTPTAPPVATGTPPPSPTARASLAACPAPRSFSSLTVLAHVSNADDLATGPDGSLWASDAASVLEHLDASGHVLARLSDPHVPEGMVVLSDGRLVVAEQGPDRTVVLQPSTARTTTLLQLTARGGLAGVDGIAWDATTGSILVPDSPNGTLLEVDPATGAVTHLASGMGRPVGAAVPPGGGFAVAAEHPGGLWHVPAAGGAKTQLGAVSDADDVVSTRGLLYVTLLGAQQVRAIDPSTGASAVLVNGIGAPQGLTVLPGGSIAVADSTTGTIATLAGC